MYSSLGDLKLSVRVPLPTTDALCFVWVRFSAVRCELVLAMQGAGGNECAVPSLSKGPRHKGWQLTCLDFSDGGSCCMQIRNCTTLSSPAVWRAHHACSFHVLSAASLALQRVLEGRHECWGVGGRISCKLRVAGRLQSCVCIYEMFGGALGKPRARAFQKLQHDAAPCKLHT